MKPKIKIAFASGTDELNARLIGRMRDLFPELPLYVVSEFPPPDRDVHWVRYRGGFVENLRRCRHTFRNKSIRLAGVLLVPRVPFRRMRLLALVQAPLYFLAINENLNDFMLRPGSLPAIARHCFWRLRNFVRWHLGAGDHTLEQSAPALLTETSSVYPGKAASGKPTVLVVSAYVPFPLSHGGAVRIYNLTQRAAADWDQILVCFTESDAPPAPELLAIFVEVIFVRRPGSHLVSNSGQPETVGEFASAVFRASLRDAVRKWKPVIAQLEFTHMAQYAEACAPARPILVEHDITFDLYGQMARDRDDWDLHRELKRWRRYETEAWTKMACVVTMSAKDEATVAGARTAVLPNGVDLRRFEMAAGEPEPCRLLFIGSFSHLPNVLGLEFFLNEAWKPLRRSAPEVRLHVIAGASHEYFLDHHRRSFQIPAGEDSGIEMEGFVADVRPAYQRAAIVVAPLVASAGTNLKILEAMACGRPVVSTPAGVNGLDLVSGRDFILANTGAEMAAAIERLMHSPEERNQLATAGRRRVEEAYDWDAIAKRQTELYRQLIHDLSRS